MVTPQLQPFRTVGDRNDFWMVRYDKRGATESPETLDHVHAQLRSGEYTDVVVFSHGWNNDWQAATQRYDSFVDGVVGQLPDDPARRALLVGVFWPSALLVLPGERAPAVAAAAGDAVQGTDPLVADALDELDPSARDRVVRLCGQDELDRDDSDELATLLAPLYRSEGDELGEGAPPPEPSRLAEHWRTAPPPTASVRRPAADEDDDDFGTVEEPAAGPQAAGLLSTLDPRNAVRAASVWLMKDRAGRVGARGVGPLVREALHGSDARVHLVGHSFGAKVALSALCAGPVERPVHSMLLLQPAVNHLCFAERVRGGGPGGYRPALARVTRPVLTTYSRHDAPLTRFFHWALRRDSDLGEPQPAAWPEPPSDYAALGGFGPRGADADTQWLRRLPAPGEAYALDPERPLAAVDATRGIRSHGGVSVPETWWALRELMAP